MILCNNVGAWGFIVLSLFICFGQLKNLLVFFDSPIILEVEVV